MFNKFKKFTISAVVLTQFFGCSFPTFSMETNDKLGTSQIKNGKRKLFVDPDLSENEYEELISSYKEQFKWSSTEYVRNYMARYFVNENERFTIDKKRYKLYVLKNGENSVSYAITTQKLWDMVDKVSDIYIEHLWAKNEECDKVSILLYLIDHSVCENCRLSLGTSKESQEFYGKFMKLDRYIGKMPVFVNNVDDSKKALENLSDKHKQVLDNIFTNGEHRLLIDPVLSQDEYDELISSYEKKFEKKSFNEALGDIERFFVKKDKQFIINKKYRLYVLKDGENSASYAITTQKLWDAVDNVLDIIIEYLWAKDKQKSGYGASILLFLINYSATEKCRLKLESRKKSKGFYDKFMRLDRWIGSMPVFVNYVADSQKTLDNLSDKYKKILSNIVVKKSHGESF